MSSNSGWNLPSVNDLMRQNQLKPLLERLSHNVVVERIRDFLDDVRDEVQEAAEQKRMPNVTELADRIAQRLLVEESPPLRSVINATGAMLPPQLGVPPLAEAAWQAASSSLRDFANIKIDLDTGKELSQVTRVEKLCCDLTGAEAALVVNNHAAAIILTLSALAGNREVLIARGQIGETLSGTRLTEIACAAGVQLREVGSANAASLADYRAGLDEKVAAIWNAEPFAYRVMGKTSSANPSELAGLAYDKRVPLIDDLGAASLLSLANYGLPYVPVIRPRLEQGSQLVLFQGDRFIGGPACGLVIGKKHLIDRLRNHPLATAMHADQASVSAFGATLRLYQDEGLARREVPLLQLLDTSLENLRQRAERIAQQMAASEPIAEAVPVMQTTSVSGLPHPDHQLSSWAIALTAKEMAAQRVADLLRRGTQPVIARVEAERVIIDLRSVFARQDQALVSAVQALGQVKPPIEDAG